MNNIIGIDPGVTGALVAVHLDGKLEDWMLMPTYKDGRRHRTDLNAVQEFIERNCWTRGRVFVEKVGPMPGDTPMTAWTFGANEAIVVAAARYHGVEFIQPKKWQAALLHGMPRSGRGQIKKSAVKAAIGLHPELEATMKLKKNWGVADAACIAELGRRIVYAK